MEDSRPVNTPSSPSSPSFLKHKLKLKWLSCSFRKTNHPHASLPASPLHPEPKLSRSSSNSPCWIRPRTHDIPELKDKCKNFISRIRRNAHGHGNERPGGHRRRHSVGPDFHYDAMSYALNFDEGQDDSIENEFRLRTFLSRLPASPKRDIECTY